MLLNLLVGGLVYTADAVVVAAVAYVLRCEKEKKRNANKNNFLTFIQLEQGSRAPML